MENDKEYRLELVKKHRDAAQPLFTYIPWLQKKQESKTVRDYSGEKTVSGSLSVPVYDSTLMSFVKAAQNSGMITRNYVYVFSRNHIQTLQDEYRMIERAQLQDLEIVWGIMAKYVLGGMTKGRLWTEAVENGIFLKGLLKIKEVLDMWDKSKS